jgi:hypothetical protein
MVSDKEAAVGLTMFWIGFLIMFFSPPVGLAIVLLGALIAGA